jgi:maltose alpha-D-glucosyltransferase/alpha-amylase
MAASSSRDNPFHHYYVWRYDEPPDTSDEAIFPPHQKGVWTYAPGVDGWYLHRFYEHQADLNITHPQVREEMKKVIAFWLKLGVCGFRVDAVPFLIELRGTPAHAREQELGFLDELCDYMRWHRGDAVLLAEANVSAEAQQTYFGGGGRMQMVFNFLVNQQLFLALARGSAEPLSRCLKQMHKPPKHCQWGMFLRNHDELSLDRLTAKERDECFREFAPEETMRLFERGVRRRLAPMLKGDRRKLLLASSVLLTLPGTPVFWYGEEIGMTEDLALPERFSIRTPMQWSGEKNAGFSTAPPQMLVRPIAASDPSTLERVNVEAQESDPDSLLNAIQAMIRTRKQHPAFGCGDWEFLKTNAPRAVLAHTCSWDGETMLAVHNFAPRNIEVTLWSRAQSGVAAELVGRRRHTIDSGKIKLRLEPFGFRWMRIEPEPSPATDSTPRAGKKGRAAKSASRKKPASRRAAK